LTYNHIHTIDISELGVDIHLDTPTEPLHTVLLGVVKYFWAQSAFVLEQQKKVELLESRLRSVNTSGLAFASIHAEYICQFRGVLIGKHFKILVQVMPFVIYDLVSADLLNVWLLLGELVVMLWQTSIDDLEVYLVCG
jgi:hypothetical protein